MTFILFCFSFLFFPSPLLLAVLCNCGIPCVYPLTYFSCFLFDTLSPFLKMGLLLLSRAFLQGQYGTLTGIACSESVSVPIKAAFMETALVVGFCNTNENQC